MFNSKKKSLIDKNRNASVNTTMKSSNPIIKAILKKASTTTSLGNGAKKLLTTGSDFVDQFGKITTYRERRSYEDISNDMSKLWKQNKLLTMCLLFYIRMITRVVYLFSGSKTSTVQRGQGLKHEGIMRMIWVAINAPDTFWKNIPLFISIGSWKDVFVMLSYDLEYHGWNGRVLDWEQFGQLILAGLENPSTSNLVKKYLPQIKSISKCTTIESQADTLIGKWICSLLFGTKENESGSTYKKYRKLKSSGTAHEWQQLISQGRFLEINFDTVAGRALAQLVSSKFLENNGLEESYEKWISSKPVAKFTGYVYELFKNVKSGYNNLPIKRYQADTINKQFYNLIETAKKGMKTDSTLLVVVDSSASMTSEVPGTKVSAYDVAKSMALYFSYLLTGVFYKSFMEFNDESNLRYWTGSTPVENIQNDESEAYGNTDFQSIAATFIKLLAKGVPESEFPTGILCISDGCFDSSDSNKSSFKQLLHNLERGGFSKEYINNFKVILWDIPNFYYDNKPQTAFEEFADCPNLFYLSGLDGSAIAFITGTERQTSIPKTADELFLAAMDQEVLSLIEV